MSVELTWLPEDDEQLPDIGTTLLCRANRLLADRRVIKLWRYALELADDDEESSSNRVVSGLTGVWVGPVGPGGPTLENGTTGADFELRNGLQTTSKPAPLSDLPGPTQKSSGASDNAIVKSGCRACGGPLDAVEQAAGFGLHLDCTLPPGGAS